jgi:hypothetical protein
LSPTSATDDWKADIRSHKAALVSPFELGITGMCSYLLGKGGIYITGIQKNMSDKTQI